MCVLHGGMAGVGWGELEGGVLFDFPSHFRAGQREPSPSTMWIVPAPRRKCHNYRSQTKQNTCGAGP